MSKKVMFILLFFLTVFITACACESRQVRQTAGRVAYAPASGKAAETYEIVKNQYSKGNIKISFPQIANSKDKRKQKKVNRIIKEEALKIIGIYKISAEKDLSIDVNYIIRLAEPYAISIQYTGYSNVKNTAHPNNLFYTTNIDMIKGSRLRLRDVVYVDENLVKKFKEGQYKNWETGLNAELKAAVIEEVNKLSARDLIKYFNEADNIGAQNPSGTYSYLTRDALGISASVPHVMGEHAEFEINYRDMRNNLNEKNEVSKRLLNR